MFSLFLWFNLDPSGVQLYLAWVTSPAMLHCIIRLNEKMFSLTYIIRVYRIQYMSNELMHLESGFQSALSSLFTNLVLNVSWCISSIWHDEWWWRYITWGKMDYRIQHMSPIKRVFRRFIKHICKLNFSPQDTNWIFLFFTFWLDIHIPKTSCDFWQLKMMNGLTLS